MFTPKKVYEYILSSGKITPHINASYGSDWRITKRVLTLSTITDTNYPYLQMEVSEFLSREYTFEREGTNYVTEIKDIKTHWTVSYYPERGSEMYLLLVALGDGNYRGNTESLTISRLFWEVMIHWKALAEPMSGNNERGNPPSYLYFSGQLRMKTNEFPVFFPEIATIMNRPGFVESFASRY